MFRRSSEPLALSEASLLALRPAMNAPVLNVKFLPVGPARAAIVVFAEEYGGMGLAIGVRSNEGGQVVVFKNQEPIDASVGVAEALESALGSAERLGFLFDEDMVESVPGGQGRAQAMALWGRLMGELELPNAPPAIPSQPATSESILEPPLHSARPKLSASDPAALLDVNQTATAASPVSNAEPEAPELLLDDLAAEDLAEISLDLETAGLETADIELDDITPTQADDLTPPDSAPSDTTETIDAAVMPPAQQLSKFRNAATDEVDDAAAAGASALGRIPLVRVRREGSRRIPFLSRLLSSF